MIKNYLKTAWRNLLQNKATSFISIAGLAVGICCFLLLATYLINELRYDRFHDKADRIVRVAYNYKSADDKEGRYLAVTQTAVVPVYKQEFSEIADGVRVFNYSGNGPAAVAYSDKIFNEKSMLTADASFFKVFSFNFIKGNRNEALSGPSSIVISQSTAKKYFGSDDAIGKVLKVNEDHNLMVTGVIEDVPAYSQIKFDMIANSAIMPGIKELRWNSASNYSYFLLKPDANVSALQAKMNAYIKNILKEQNKDAVTLYTLEPLTSVHLYSTALYSLEAAGSIKYIYILGIVAVVLLLLACVNFLNLVTARSAERAREIGVRKVMGAVRGQLFVQFIMEAGIITLFSLVAGVVLLYVLFPAFSTFTGQQLGFKTWNSTWLVEALVALFILVTLLAGTYPSLFLSAFKPIVTLKAKHRASPAAIYCGNRWLSSSLWYRFSLSSVR
jgi:putative ABC transport system permease protein